jgi:hypothetical protein
LATKLYLQRWVHAVSRASWNENEGLESETRCYSLRAFLGPASPGCGWRLVGIRLLLLRINFVMFAPE